MARARNPYYFYCPHCKHRLAIRNASERTGYPIMTCSKCGKTCVDPFTKEPAFEPYFDAPKGFFAQLPFSLLLLGWIALSCLVGWLAGGSLNRSALSFVLVIWLLFTLWLLWPKKKAQQKEFNAWQESDKRLRNGQYATSLHLFGFDVPPYYLPSFAERTKNPVHLDVVWLQHGSGPKAPGPNPNRIYSWHPEQD